MDYIIKTENLSKHYGQVKAVNNIFLKVNKGEIYGFLGMNGAGKTTTIRMLLGMVSPTTGSSYLFGKTVSPNRDDIWKKVGYIVETPYSYPDLTVKENLEIARRLHQIEDKNEVDEIIDKLKLTPYSSRKVKNLSTGNAQRLGLARALLHRPELLLLDEPINGLDPAGIVEIRELLSNLSKNKGVTIFISSHILNEISKLANRIGIIHQGRLIQEVDRKELKELRDKRLVVDGREQKSIKDKLHEVGFSVITDKEGKLEIRDQKAVKYPENIAKILVKADLPPTLLKVEDEDLESYFLNLVKNEGGLK